MLLAALGLAFQIQLPTSAPYPIDLVAWRFRAGDELLRPLPAYDDSGWDTVRVPHGWHPTAEGGGYAWYRLHVTIRVPPDQPLALWFRGAVGAFEVYVDGRFIGGNGGFPPRYRARAGIPLVRALPLAALQPGPHVIAVRVYSEETLGGLVNRVSLGETEALRADAHRSNLWFAAAAILLTAIGIHQLFFWLRRPLASEHLAILIMCGFLTLVFVSWMPSVRVLLEPVLYYRRLLLASAAAAAAAYVHGVRRLFDFEGDRVLPAFTVAFLLLAPLSLLLPRWGQLQFLSSYVQNPLLLLGAVTTLVLAALQMRAGSRYAHILVVGNVVLALSILHAILVDFDVLQGGATVPWVVLAGSLTFVGSIALTTAEKFVDSETASLNDRLTGLYRREVVLDALSREIRRSARTREPIAVIMLDLDKFKQINDTLGHQAGDKVLAEVGRRLVEAGRSVDWLGRYGGEEFIAICASTDAAGATLAAERLRKAVSALPIATGRTGRTLTLSAGVAAYEGGEEWPTVEQLVGAADEALYRAKHAGRDCVMV